MKNPNFQFEVVDSSTTLEGIRIEEIIPSLLLGSRENPCEALCYAICALNSNPNCVKDWKKKLCN
ncbi:hypothetical protein Mic7113_3178 [Allocoleopsis franciscana PCC 7113]|uniref:Uncharacterized protein n=1 Tax=Allocoleopsis franciscana PCC 7113 TaxID=1173027 RepID=K9WET6_9CYAN|nr:hypothetical protein Mic7113_3178 [Allocoleopsis franciscana PCC 7113]